MKKELLIYANSLEKALINILKNINYNKYEVTLYLEELKGTHKKNIPKKVKLKEHKIFKSKIKKLYTRIKFKLKNYHKYDCAILYSINSYEGNLCVINASKNRIMLINKDYTIYKDETRNFFTKRNIYDYTNIIFLSNEAKNNFLKYYPSLSKKTHVINNFINYEEIEKNSLEKIKEKIKRTDINLLYIGELKEEKNKIINYFKLIKELLLELPNLKLFIIGDGVDRFAYETYIEDNNLQENIFLLGQINNPYPYIKKCHYLITNIKNEFIIESLLLKTEVISTTKISDDVFELGNNYGFLISKQPNKMKEELKKIITNKQKKKTKFDFIKINKEKQEKLEKIINNDR